MKPDPQSSFPTDYRRARQAFIAACEDHGIDVISRVHPQAKGPDDAPLFLDVAATGPRDARKALILLSGVHGVDGPFGSAVQTRLVRAGVAPPPGTRLVMVHAVNPFGFAWGERPGGDDHDGPGGRDTGWPAKALAAICTEDLAKARKVIAISFQTGQTDKRQSGHVRMIVNGGDEAHAARARAIWGNVIMADTCSDEILRDGLAEILAAQILARVELTFAVLEVGVTPPDILPANTQWQEQAWDHARRCVLAALSALS